MLEGGDRGSFHSAGSESSSGSSAGKFHGEHTATT